MLTEKIFLAFIRFYEHNDPLLFLVPLIVITLVALIIKPRRRKVFFLIGLSLLALQFEYSKVIFKEVKADWLNQVFAEDFRFRKYQFGTFFFQDIVPFALSAAGWIFLALTALI